MVDRVIRTVPRRAALLVAAALMLGGPASGQGPLPPVPGPYLVSPGAGLAPHNQAPLSQAPVDTNLRPMFQPPANALRVPYWMQAPVAGDTPAASAETAVERPASAQPEPGRAQQTGPAQPQAMAPPYGWPMPAWGPAPYGMQPPWVGQSMPGQANGQPAPGWGYAPGTAWGPMPMQPGWGVPVGGTGQ